MWFKTDDQIGCNLDKADFINVIDTKGMFSATSSKYSKAPDEASRGLRQTPPAFAVLAHYGEVEVLLSRHETRDEAQQALDILLDKLGATAAK